MGADQSSNHPMSDSLQQDEQEFQKPIKLGFWRKLGGGALSIAIIIHVILAIIGGIWIAQRIYEPEKKIDFLPGGGSAGGGERGAQTKVQQKKRSQITPTTNVKRVFAEGASSNFSIPDPGDNFGEMSTLSSLAGGGMSGGLGGSGSGGGFGSGTGSGTGLGMGTGTGKLFGLIPETMRKRCSKEDRLARLKENGGTPECEEAVKKGLQWLKANQNADGSWSISANGTANTSAMTGLALLAYFGHCETPMSEEFGESCLKGIVYLVDMGVKNKGVLTPDVASGTQSSVYEHAIATYALGEAATFCKELKIEIPSLMEVTRQAGQFIIDNQNENGGWAYGYATKGGHTDSSIVGWQLQALKACHHSKIEYKGLDSSVRKGLKFLTTLQHENGGFGYNSKDPRLGLTGVGVLCFQMWGKEKSSEVRKGLKYLKENTSLDWATANSDLYAHYYISQAMMQAGGANWSFYNKLFRDQLLSNQNPDGSWKAPAFSGHGQTPAGDVYRNTLCILMLEVYYRFLATSGGGGGGGRSGRPEI
jgi:hypothetical protein